MTSIAIIPARGGSVRIPRKNIRLFHGRPIITYSIETATHSGLFDHIVVSTDDDEIAAISMAAGAEVFRRPPDAGIRGTQEVAREALWHYVDQKSLGRNWACCIYPTAPLMMAGDLKEGLAALFEQDDYADYAMAVGTDPLRDAGQWYFGAMDAFLENMPLISIRTAMVPIPDARICDINTEEDWNEALRLYTKLWGIPKA